MLNQLLKNIELPDRYKRAARSLQESCLFSVPVQPALCSDFVIFIYQKNKINQQQILEKYVFWKRNSSIFVVSGAKNVIFTDIRMLFKPK